MVVPKGITTIEENTFYNCEALSSVELPEGLKTIAGEAFSTCGALRSVELPKGLTSIGTSAFGFSTNLSEVTIPTSVTEIGDGAFSGTALTSVAIPAGVKELGGVFPGCLNLGKVTLPEGLEGLDGTFSACEKLTEITIPASVKSIADYTFLGCTALNKVYYLAAADAAVADNAFDGIANPATLFVRKGEKEKIEGNGKAWKGAFTIEERNVVTFDADGGLPTPAAQWLEDGGKAVEPSQKPEKKGFKFEGWTLLSGEDYHFGTPVQGNIELKAKYVAEYTLTITSGANGSVKVTRNNAQGDALTGAAKLHEGDKLFIAATPAEGYELETLTVNGAAFANSSVFTVGKANVEVKATFKAKGGATSPSAVESVQLATARVVQNPIANALVLEGISTAERIEVYSLTGVQTYACAPRGEERVEIATGSWASGIYVVRIIAADGEKTLRVVK